MPAHGPPDALTTGVAVAAVGLMTKEFFGERKLLAAFSASADHRLNSRFASHE
jgi:hypothetical protein